MTRSMYFFFGRENPLSNWHPCDFTVNGVRFSSNEQLMMFAKAKLFKDEVIAAKILRTHEPAEQKHLGRAVQGFMEPVWQEKCEHYVYVGARAKFSQNPPLAQFLIHTGDSELVEASRYDPNWGCGLSADNPLIHDKRNWRGRNRLGPILERVRDHVRTHSV